jgi:hypothetical protein
MPRFSARGLNRRSNASSWPGERTPPRQQLGTDDFRDKTTVKIRGRAAAFSWQVAPLQLLQLRNSMITSAEPLLDLGERRSSSPVAVRAQHEGVSSCSNLWSSPFSCSRSWPCMSSDGQNGRSSITMIWSGVRGNCRLLPSGKRKRGLEPRWGCSFLPLPASPRHLQPPRTWVAPRLMFRSGRRFVPSASNSTCGRGFSARRVFPVLIRPGRCDAHSRRARPHHREALGLPSRSRTAHCRRSR